MLGNFRGRIMCDGYVAYDNLEKLHIGIECLNCWAHARRKFEHSLSYDKTRAEYALQQIQLLYAVEHEADEKGLSFGERAALRQRVARPILVAFQKWMLKNRGQVIEQSPIYEALNYTASRYEQLSRYMEDGRYSIDNNGGENTIRPIVVGRKNYMFCGNDDAAENAAIIYSLMGCCKAADVDFRQWLMYVLDNIHSYDNDYSKDLADFLPQQWKVSHPETSHFKLEKPAM